MTLAALVAQVGHASVPLLDPRALDELRRFVASLDVDLGDGFYASANDPDRGRAEAVDEEVRRRLAPHLARVLPDHTAFLGSLLAKPARTGAQISLHQDLSYTDERTTRTVIAWIPLCDVDASSGALAVVPGSARWATGSRPSGGASLPTDAVQDHLAPLAELVPLAAGDALFYDPATIHGSPANSGPAERIALGVALKPKGSQLVHVHLDEADRAVAYAVDEAFYSRQGLRNRPVGYPELPLWAPTVQADELAQRCGVPT